MSESTIMLGLDVKIRLMQEDELFVKRLACQQFDYNQQPM